jgi:hypothetical protein
VGVGSNLAKVHEWIDASGAEGSMAEEAPEGLDGSGGQQEENHQDWQDACSTHLYARGPRLQCDRGNESDRSSEVRTRDVCKSLR